MFHSFSHAFVVGTAGGYKLPEIGAVIHMLQVAEFVYNNVIYTLLFKAHDTDVY